MFGLTTKKKLKIQIENNKILNEQKIKLYQQNLKYQRQINELTNELARITSEGISKEIRNNVPKKTAKKKTPVKKQNKKVGDKNVSK